MRTHLPWLLSLFLLALRCHECSMTGNCFQPTSCQNSTRYCLTTWNSESLPLVGQQTIVVKSRAYTRLGFRESLLAVSRACCCNADLSNSTARPSALHLNWCLVSVSLGCEVLEACVPSRPAQGWCV
uniref:Snake toxin/toxin-like domain-containing protein n=1 Tax=Prolemur simus TaxID=1328070 RepID=A0A8C8YFH7_PROSS